MTAHCKCNVSGLKTTECSNMEMIQELFSTLDIKGFRPTYFEKA